MLSATGEHREAVPLAFARALLKSAQSRGCDIGALLERAHFPCDPRQVSQPAVAVSIEDYSRLCFALFGELNDESGGIMGDLPAAFGTTRLLLHAIIGCKTLGAVLERAAEFNCCCLERTPARSVHLQVDGGLATLSYAPPDLESLLQNYAGSLCGLAIWLRLCGWLLGQGIDPARVRCAGAEPDCTQAIRHFYHCPVEFGFAAHSVTFNARLLSAPVIRSREELDAFLPVAPYYLVIRPVAGERSVGARIRDLLGDDFVEMPGFDALTERLNMSARTLRRRLEKEGTSYQRIKDNARRDAAIELLARTGLPVAEVADRIGFSDPSAFHRSFKKWTGLAPGEYR